MMRKRGGSRTTARTSSVLPNGPILRSHDSQTAVSAGINGARTTMSGPVGRGRPSSTMAMASATAGGVARAPGTATSSLIRVDSITAGSRAIGTSIGAARMGSTSSGGARSTTVGPGVSTNPVGRPRTAASAAGAIGQSVQNATPGSPRTPFTRTTYNSQIAGLRISDIEQGRLFPTPSNPRGTPGPGRTGPTQVTKRPKVEAKGPTPAKKPKASATATSTTKRGVTQKTSNTGTQASSGSQGTSSVAVSEPGPGDSSKTPQQDRRGPGRPAGSTSREKKPTVAQPQPISFEDLLNMTTDSDTGEGKVGDTEPTSDEDVVYTIPTRTTGTSGHPHEFQQGFNFNGNGNSGGGMQQIVEMPMRNMGMEMSNYMNNGMMAITTWTHPSQMLNPWGMPMGMIDPMYGMMPFGGMPMGMGYGMSAMRFLPPSSTMIVHRGMMNQNNGGPGFFNQGPGQGYTFGPGGSAYGNFMPQLGGPGMSMPRRP